MANTTAVGQVAEAQALAWLTTRGLQLVEHNARRRFFELDLVMLDGETVVFVEVKYRANADFGGGEAAISLDKQRRLLAGAQAWLVEYGWEDRSVRFDVVVAGGEIDNCTLQHYPDCLVLDV